MNRPLIKIKNLNSGYGNQIVIKDNNIEIFEKDFILITGTNGAGKSTFVKTLLGLIPVKSGKIEFNSQKVVQPMSSFIGYVPQYIDIDRTFPISVREVISLGCVKGANCPLDPEEHLKDLGSEYLIDKKISDLSGGELQRVLIARGLINNPKVVILDEPTNNLDAESRSKLISLLKKLNKQGKTVIIITHDFNLTKQFKNPKVINFENGLATQIDKSEMLKIHAWLNI